MKRKPRESFLLFAGVLCVVVGLVGFCRSSGHNGPRPAPINDESEIAILSDTTSVSLPKPTPIPTPRRYRLVYRLAGGSENWPPKIRKRIIAAMDYAVTLYNEEGEFDKTVIANYSPKIRTANANYNGWINFGGSINGHTALHEISHTLGVGQHRNWRKLIVDRKWTGGHALAKLRNLDGPNAVLHADRMHFWPYGLNYGRESNPENDRRHVRMVAALRLDMGITNGRR